MSSLLKRQAKDLLSLVGEMQDYNSPVPAYCLGSIRDLLRNFSHCAHVEIVGDVQVVPTYALDRVLLSAFILSQLDSQKLTSRDSPRVVITPGLGFVLDFLAPPPSRETGHPVLITWYSSPSHRRYLLLAHIDRHMATRGYSLEELQQLRQANAANIIAKRISQDPDLAAMAPRSESRPLANKSKAERSSDSSDEVVFKGRRAVREARQQSLRTMNHRDCKDRSKDSTIAEPMTEPPLQPHADIPRDAQEDAVPKTSHEAPVAHMPQQYEWKYTGRSEQDRTSTIHPLVAPAGNLVQKSEGFQRFYKAVVSPTHVRVTAGGRIVPNTRGPPSPTSKRAKEAPGIDNQSAAENATQPNLTASRMGSIAGTPMAAFVPQYIPGFTPGQPSLYPGMSFIPLAYGPPFPAGFPFAPGSNPFQQQVAATESNALKETQNSKDVESSMQPAAAAPDQTDNVRLAPPEQFDSTRPFWFNGQLLYPYPRPAPLPGQPSGSFMPFPMMSMPPGLGMPHHPFAGQMLPGGPNSSSMAPPMMPANPPGAAPMPSQMVPAIHPNPAPMHNSMAPMMPQNPNASAAHHPPMAPHASSIRQSEITKKQIGNFKATLKFFEDQLLYNRHQIDEKDFELKIQNTKANIEKFNATLQQQLQFEAAHYPRTQDEHERTEQQVPAATTLAETARKARMTQTDSSSSTFDVVEKLLSIPSEAALAPVFEPRVHSASWGETDTRQGSRVDLERRSIPANAGRDSSSARADTTSSTGSFKAANPRPAYRESSTTGSSAEQSVKFNVPYLLGSLPAGVDPRTAKDSDYTYVRPLTEDELRARHLYWGKAPKVARQGLPKYDGRHFYPASPVKEHGSRAQAADVYDADPFRTGATAVARTNSPAGSDDSECAALQHASSFETQVPYKSESMERIARGEEPMASSKLLKAVVTKGATSSALSPATAQGYLPQYTGYAAASLSPSGNRNQASSARETSPSKLSAPGANDHMSASLGEGGAMHGHHIENRPIAMVSTEAMRRGLH